MPRQMSLAVVGADFPNRRGPTRRFEIAMCDPGEPVELRPEPKNRADLRAIAVFSLRGIQIGYVRAERAALVKALLNRGLVDAIFQQADSWGCTIRIGYDGAEASLPEPDDARAYDWPPPGSEDTEWWPDDIPPDD